MRGLGQSSIGEGILRVRDPVARYLRIGRSLLFDREHRGSRSREEKRVRIIGSLCRASHPSSRSNDLLDTSSPTFSGAPWGVIFGGPHGTLALTPTYHRRALNSRSDRSRFWWRLADSCPHNVMYSACIPALLADPGMCATA